MNWPGMLSLLMIGLALTWHNGRADEGEDMRKARDRMVKEIELDVITTADHIGRPRLNREVMKVIGEVPRHEFVPEHNRDAAYVNRPLPIGYGQTISQPYIVALMTDLLAVSRDAKVLEVGAGSGYQAAILSRLVKEVHSIEIIPELARECRARLQRLGYGNVTVHEGDGYYGLEAEAPFDAIVVTAAAAYIPPPLVRQLKPGGRMVIPVGAQFAVQYLMLVEKTALGEISTRNVLPVQFVPLTGQRE
ncbi:MAG: protein-L-isoaspartate(D-aspartate) O-methyltransferase [Desulfoprunum sp.]|jgi:protein-L-isoaspartate(D-aspartate) O-methyltransferase